MRTIKFRGKRVDNGEWVFGNVRNDFYKPDAKTCEKWTFVEVIYDRYIYPFTVDVNTIGQFTGLKDKNGVEIYEDDIINIGEIPDKQHFVVTDIRFMNDILHEVDRHVWLDVIGNIHDDPELIKITL